jgi:phosphonopyruvate decarboxylase
MVGSMGCVSSFGLGIALAQPHRRVIVIDGDGAALMRLGAITTIGYERPANLCHILLDNQRHESTGGQSTVSHSVDFSVIAAACGYEKVGIATTPQQVTDWITTIPNLLSFLHIKIKPGTPDKLPRPKVTPVQVAHRLRQFINSKQSLVNSH